MTCLDPRLWHRKKLPLGPTHPSHHVGSPQTDEHRHRKADTEPPGMESTIDSFEAEDQQLDMQQLDKDLQAIKEGLQGVFRLIEAAEEAARSQAAEAPSQAADWIMARLELAQRLSRQLEAEGKFKDAATVLKKAADECKRHVVGSE